MDLIRWSTLAYTMSHDVVMLYAVVTLLYAVHSRSTHGVCIPALCGVMDASSHRSHGSPHHRIMDHGDVVDHVLSLDVPGDGISISMAIGYRWYRGYHRMVCYIHHHPSWRDTVWILLLRWVLHNHHHSTEDVRTPLPTTIYGSRVCLHPFSATPHHGIRYREYGTWYHCGWRSIPHVLLQGHSP